MAAKRKQPEPPILATTVEDLAKSSGLDADQIDEIMFDLGHETIWVGDVKVAEKTQLGFPDERDILHAVEAALEGSG